MKSKRLQELKQLVASSYEVTAKHFDATRSKAAAVDFLWAANQIGPDDEVLDAGCGNGRLLNYNDIEPTKYLGLDQSATLVDLAAKHHSQHRFIHQALEDLSALPADSFSVIFCSAVIMHLPGSKERRQVLQEFLRVGHNRARLIISFWKMEGKYRHKLWLTRLRKLSGRHPYGWRDLIFPWRDAQGNELSSRYYHAFTKRSFKRELSRAGWDIEAARDDRFNYWVIARKK